jgi:CubicO group peptidase (beta-lactamase class C family)
MLRFNGWLSVLFAFSLLLSAAGATADTPTPALDPALTARIETLVRDTMAGVPTIPGIGLGIIEDGQIVYTKGFGVQSTATQTPVTSESVFLLASISKTATATSIMQLKEQGKIDLDAPVVKYLPYFKLDSDTYQSITIRQLLGHRAGLDYGKDEDEAHYRSPSLDDGALERWVRGMASDKALWQPGKRFYYSDLGFEILGDVIAKVGADLRVVRPGTYLHTVGNEAHHPAAARGRSATARPAAPRDQ